MRKSLGVISTLLIFALSAFGQQYNIATFAGGAPLPNSSSVSNSPIGNPTALASDVASNIYFISNNAVYFISVGALSRLAGNSRVGFSGDGGNSAQAQLSNPLGIAVDSVNNVLYIADTGNNRIRKVTGLASSPTITTIAGNGTASYTGDGGLATGATVNSPEGLAVDSSGNLYIADTGNNVIRKITVATGIITTVAGNGTAGTSGDGQLATSAQLNAPTGVALDAAANIYIADSKNNRIRKVISSIMSTVAGNGVPGFAGDNNLAILAELNTPTQVNVAASGVIYILDSGNARVREIQTNLVISTVAGPGGAIPTTNPTGVTTDPNSNLYVADMTHVIFRATSSTPPSVSNFAGSMTVSFYLGDGGPAISAQLIQPEGLAVDATGVYIADRGEARVRKVSGGTIATPAGGTSIAPVGTAVDASGNFYIADAALNEVLRISQPAGTVTLVAGTGAAGSGGDNGLATSAQLNQPSGVAVDTSGNIYIADTGNHKVRKVTFATGIITTIAGNNTPGFAGDNLPSTNGVLNSPFGVAVDINGNVYIADTLNNRIRKITAATGLITTVAGNGNPGPSGAGDGGPATAAAIATPHEVAVDSILNLYVPDSNARVRKVSVSGIITTIAGTGTPGYSGDGGAALSAQVNTPWGVTVDSSGNVYFSDPGDLAVFKLTPVAPSSPLSITTSSTLPSGTVGIPYAQALSAMGGTPPYTWSNPVGSLPNGLTFSPSGSISGTPTTSQSSLFTVQVTDSASITMQANFTILINPANANGLTITSPPTLPAGAIEAGVGLPYSQTLTAISGNPPYTWTLVNGTLPSGLSLSPTGVIFGTPVTTGTSNFTIRVNDTSNAVSTQTFTLQVISAGTPTQVGALAHFAAGGPWTTRAYLTNISTSAVVVNLVIHTDDGSILPLNVTQQGVTQVFGSNTFTGVMNPNSTIIVNAGAGLGNTETGWIDVLSTGASNSMAGFAIFRLTLNASGAVSEGTSPLQTQFEPRMDVLFDNTGGFNTDLAIANLSTTATTVTATVLDQNGNLLGTYSLPLAANGHTAFIFPSQFGVTANQQGLVQFVSSSGSNIAGVGLRANTGAATGAFTSVPIILP